LYNVSFEMTHFSKSLLAGMLLLAPISAWAQGMQLGNQQVYTMPIDAASTQIQATQVSSAVQGAVLLTSGTMVLAQRSVGFVITAAATVTFTLADASTITLALPVSAQLQTLPFAVTKVVVTAGTGTFWNLK
jgi:hypothetical protein